MSELLRLFVALDPPQGLATRLADWASQEGDDPAIRALSASQLHITLAFLGPTEPERLGEISACLAAAVRRAGPIPLALGPEPVPVPGQRPRLLALEVQDLAPGVGIGSLQAGIATGLGRLDVFEPEQRAFWPHITLIRVRRSQPGSRRPARLRSLPGSVPEELLEPFDAVRLALYRSDPRPSGASYVPLASYELPSQTAEGE